MIKVMNERARLSPGGFGIRPSVVRRVAAAAGVLIGVLAAAAAQSDAPGRLAVKASQPVPPGSRIHVEALGPDQRAEALLDVVADALARKGYEIVDPGDLILQVHVTNAAAPPREDRKVTLSGRGGSRSRSRIEVRVRLHKKKERPLPRQLLSVQFFLFERGRPPIWSGSVTAPGGPGDEAERLARMADAAMTAFGKTEERPFDPAQESMDRPE